jgi:hypothetical protein
VAKWRLPVTVRGCGQRSIFCRLPRTSWCGLRERPWNLGSPSGNDRGHSAQQDGRKRRRHRFEVGRGFTNPVGTKIGCALRMHELGTNPASAATLKNTAAVQGIRTRGDIENSIERVRNPSRQEDRPRPSLVALERPESLLRVA